MNAGQGRYLGQPNGLTPDTDETNAATDHWTLRLDSMISDSNELRDRARQCRALAKTARDDAMRFMLERMADDFDREAEIESAATAGPKGQA